ncbi:MAG: DUF4169 family protein [Pseudolabrys sp.]
MTDTVNLRTARKRAQRRQQELAAAASRLAHGRPAVERKRDAARRDQANRVLDQHRIETEDKR